MYNIKLFCFHQYDEFPPSVIGKSGKTKKELINWAAVKVFPLLLKGPYHGGHGSVTVALFDESNIEIGEKTFYF